MIFDKDMEQLGSLLPLYAGSIPDWEAKEKRQMLWQNADLKCIPRPVLACEAHRQCVNYLQCSSADIRGGWCQQGCLLSHALLVELPAAQLLVEAKTLWGLLAACQIQNLGSEEQHLYGKLPRSSDGHFPSSTFGKHLCTNDPWKKCTHKMINSAKLQNSFFKSNT